MTLVTIACIRHCIHVPSSPTIDNQMYPTYRLSHHHCSSRLSPVHHSLVEENFYFPIFVFLTRLKIFIRFLKIENRKVSSFKMEKKLKLFCKYPI